MKFPCGNAVSPRVGRHAGRGMRIALSLLAFLAAAAAFPAPGHALDRIDRSGFALGIGAGYGSVDVRADNVSRNSYGSFALGFRCGYAVAPYAVVGLELNGWTLKGYDAGDPSKGESLGNSSLFVDAFPVGQIPFYLAGGVGRLSYSNNRPGGGGRDTGRSWFLGAGYEIPISARWQAVPQLRYSRGRFTGGNFGVYELSVGLNWYSGRRAGPAR